MAFTWLKGFTVDGDVGIGATNPACILDVTDSGINTTAPTIRLTNSANKSAADWAGAISHRIEFYSSDASGPRVASSIENIAGADKGGLVTGNLVFKTRNYPSPDVLTEKMRISEDGNVGIGTDSPDAKLHVSGQDADFFSATSNQRVRIGRSATEMFDIFVTDNNITLTATQDTDGNGPHLYILNREFGGTGDNNFEIRKTNSTQLLIDKDGAITFNNYNAANKTGTPTYLLGTDATGNVVKVLGGSIPGVAKPFVFNSSSLTGIQSAGNTASGDESIAMGKSTTASGDASTAMGFFTTASGLRSTSMGIGTDASGSYSTAMGDNTEASGYASTAIGRFNVLNTGDNATAYAATNTAFSIGNGTAGAARSDAFSVLFNGTTFIAGNTGIGTDSPDNISSTGTVLSISTQGALTTNSLAGSLTFLTNDTSFLATYADGVTTEISSISESATGAAYGIAFSTSTITGSNRAERMRITSAGNVGIGVTSPAYVLDVKTSTSDDGISLSATSGRKGVELLLDSGTNGGGDIRMYTGVSVLTNRITAQGSSYINGGNVGIGVTNPSTKLEIADSIPILRITGTRSGTWTIGQVISALQYFSEDASGQAANSVRASISLINEVSIYGSHTGLAFATKGDAAGEPNEAMRIAANGNVGIGTTTPTRPLHVVNTSSQTVAIFDGGNNGAGEIAFTGAGTSGGTYVTIGAVGNNMSLSAGASERMRITSAGNVGIGTTSPDTLFNIESALANTSIITIGCLKNDSSWTIGDRIGGINFYGADGSGAGAGVKGSINYTVESTSGGVNAMTFNVAGTSNNLERMRIDTAGNVGIGTTTPDAKLQVETTGISNTAIFENSGQSFSYTAIKVGEALGNRANLTFVVGDNLAATDIIGEISSLIVSNGGALEGAMSFKTNSGDTLTERMVISSAGALKFNAYGAGTLITDASGNITVASGGGAGGPYLPLTGGTLTGSLTVGADTDGHDVLFYGNATGEKMEWDASESRLKINHDTDDSGLDVFTVSGVIMTQPQLRVGRDPFQYWGVYTEDRNAHLVHRQDETTGAMTTRFDQWDSNTGTQAGSWQWRSGDGSGGSMATALTLTQAGVATFAGLVSGITPTSAANFVTKAYVDAIEPGAGIFLPLTGGTITGNLQILRPSTSAASFSLRRDATGDNDTVGEINYLTTAAPGGDNRLFILRTATQGGTTTTRGGKVTFFSRKIDGGFNASTYDNQGNWVFANNAIVNGNIGLGTTNPVSQLNSTKVIKLQSTGNNEIILDHTDGGVNSDLGLYSWERNNDHLAHIRSAQYSANDDAFIAFHCQPTGGSFANSAANEKMRILPTGNVGIGTITPGYKLDVSGDGRFTSTVTATNFILSSDERFKENIEEACDNRINADWKTFELKSEKGQKRYGVIAQELEETNPEFVRTDNRGFKSVAYIDLLIAKIAELEARLEKAGI